MLKRLKNWITTFDSSTGWHHYIGPYTITFLVMMVLMSFSFLLAGKGFIWAVDGLSQQYVFFAYEGIWLRELIGNLLTGQDLPLWTSQIGWGGDPFITLLSCIGDPINLLSVFVPTRFADYALNFTVPLRLYLAGLAFAGLCFYKGKTHFATLTASMVYIFSAFTSIAFTQIFMLYPLIIAPLALWGAEKLFSRESPMLFIVSMALMFMAGLTLGYSACLLLLVYCIVRFIFLPSRTNAGVSTAENGRPDKSATGKNNAGEKSARLFFILLGKFVGCIAIGAAISAIILIPSAMAILSQGRIGLERPDDLLYTISYYQSLLQGFVGHADVGADCAYGFAAIALVCVFMLFCQKARDFNSPSEVRILRTMFVLLFVFLCLPFIGRVFNGFAYANNRWVWGFVLLIAYIVASMLPECLTLSKRQGRSVFKYAVVFSLALVLLCFPVLSRNAFFGVLMMFAVLVLLTGSLGLSKIAKEGGVLLSVVICAAFLFNTYGSQFVNGGSTWALNMTGLGRAYKTVVDNDPTTQLQQMEHDEFWRYDAAGVDLVHNGNLLQDMNALRFYSSFYNQYIDDFQTGLGLRTSSINFMYSGLDSRAELESLAGVKYMVSQKGSESLVPETFVTYQNDVNVNGRIFDYSESDYNLPLIYLHDGAIPASSYEEMTPIQKQEALLQGAVLEDDGAAEMLKSVSPTFSSIAMDSTLCYPDGTPVRAGDGTTDKTNIDYDGESFRVLKGNTKLLIKTFVNAGEDVYVYVPNYSFENLLPSQRMTETQWNDMTIAAKERAYFDDAMFGKGIYDSKVLFALGGIEKEIWGPTKATHLYGGKDEWVVNLGHVEESGEVTIELTFQDPGVYRLGSLAVTSQPVQQMEAEVDALKQTASERVSNIGVTGSSLSCDAEVEGDSQLVYFSVPYSDGWSATVDGRPAEIQHANVAFMGIMADSGEHRIELRYTTPGLVPGAAISLVGLLALAGVAIHSRKMVKYPRERR